MNQTVREKEKELNRIEKAKQNPLKILGLDSNPNRQEIKDSYHRLSRLVHPDRNDGLDRFKSFFIKISKSYQLMTDEKMRLKIIRANKKDDIDFFESLWLPSKVIEMNPDPSTKPKVKRNLEYKLCQALCVYNQNELAIHQSLKKALRNRSQDLEVLIKIDGAEHTNKKCKSKADKHQKGLRQRAIQKKNAINRIKNHGFSFTNKIEIK